MNKNDEAKLFYKIRFEELGLLEINRKIYYKK